MSLEGHDAQRDGIGDEKNLNTVQCIDDVCRSIIIYTLFYHTVLQYTVLKHSRGNDANSDYQMSMKSDNLNHKNQSSD